MIKQNAIQQYECQTVCTLSIDMAKQTDKQNCATDQNLHYLPRIQYF